MTETVANVLPFAAQELKGFRSQVKLPKGAHGRTCAYAVDRIAREGESKRAQAMATLLPVEREFVNQVLEEYRTWAVAQATEPRPE